jgi:hypothetical protein
METESIYPVFDETDRGLFQIKDARNRADTLQERIVPKLKSLVEIARDLVYQAHGFDPLEDSQNTTSPAHNKNAVKTKVFTSAYAGFVPRQREGKYFYLRLILTLDDGGLMTMLHAERPLESSALFGVLKKHKEGAVELIEGIDCTVWSDNGFPPDTDNLAAIETIRIENGRQWFRTGVVGTVHDYPIDDDQRLDESVLQMVGLFGIYQAALELLRGKEEHFEDYRQQFEATFQEDTEDGPEDTTLATDDASGGENDPSPRKESTISRIIRDTAATSRVKALHDYTCQVCGLRLETGEGAYAEGAHIRPLGSPHHGPDTPDNILCLCPNHHVQFDRYGFTISDRLTLVDIPGELRTVEEHHLNMSHLAYHRERYDEASH